MTAPYIPPRPRTLEEALRAAFMPPVQADATATPPVRPDFSGVPMATMRATSAPMPRGPRETGNPAADRLNARVDRGLAMLGRAAAPSADTPEGWLREMFNPVAAGRGTREMANATGAQMRRAGRTGNVGDAAMAAGLGAVTAASVVPGGVMDDAAKQGKRVFRAHHGSPRLDLTEFAPNERGIFGTDNPSVALEYTGKRGAWMGPRTGRVYDVEFEMENPLEIDAGGARHNNIRVPWQEWKPQVFGRIPEGAVDIEAAFQKAIADGHDGLVVRNVMDSADPTTKARSTVYAVRSPEQARILNATMQSPTPEASAIRNALVPQAEPQGIRAYHGTPHRFAPEPGHPLGRFRMDKIGTGEGAQAYGHGLYFAEAPEVAETYRSSLAIKPEIQSEVDDAMDGFDYFGQDSFLDAMAYLRANPDWEKKWNPSGESGGIFDTIRNLLNDERRGTTYEVAIDASPDELLDWDAPLSKQPKFVRKAISEMGRDESFRDMVREAKREGMTAGEFYDLIAGDQDGYEFAAESFNSMGIPGAKYLDGQSRAVGQGTRNYVIWDESKIRILKALAAAGMVSPAALASAEAAYAQQQQERP